VSLKIFISEPLEA